MVQGLQMRFRRGGSHVLLGQVQVPALAEGREDSVRSAVGFHDLARRLNHVVGEGVKSHPVLPEVGLDLRIACLGVGLVILIRVHCPDLSGRGKGRQNFDRVAMGDEQRTTVFACFFLELRDAVVEEGHARVRGAVKAI